MKIVNSNILVTGGAGFIGSNLCEKLLSQNNVVTCFDNFSTGKVENIDSFMHNSNFRLIKGDVRNIEDCQKAVDGADIVLHQAALGSVPRSVHDPITTNEVNVNGFLNMLWVSKEVGIKRFVFASSSSTYGDSDEKPSVEDNIGHPLSPYAVSKLTNELYANVFSTLYGLETIGLRYFNVFGPRQDPKGNYAAAIPKFAASLSEGKSPLIYGDGKQTRDFTYVDNVIQANQLAALTDNPKAVNQVYNIAFGKCIDINAVLVQMKRVISVYKQDCADVEPIYTKERSGEVKHSYASIDKARHLLGYHPEFDFARGLKSYIKWLFHKDF